MFTLLSLLFGAFLWSVFLLGLFIIAMGLVEAFVRIVRLWKPNFLQSYTYKQNHKASQTEHSERRMLAIDFVIQERIRRQNESRKIAQQQMFGSTPASAVLVVSKPATSAAKTIEIPDEVSLDEIMKIVTEPPRPIQLEDHAAEYAVVRLVDGKKRYLCEKNVRRLESGDIKNTVAFAAIRDKAKRFDRTSAQRLLTVLPSDCFLEPYNATARIAERQTNGCVIQGLDTDTRTQTQA